MNIEKQLDAADLAVANQQYDKAMLIYQQILAENDQCDEAYLMRGALYGELGQIDKAFNDIQTAINIDPQYDGAYLTLALLHKSQGNTQQAIESFHQAIKLNSNSKEAKQHMVQLCEAQADHQLASQQVEQAIENYRLASECAPQNIYLAYKYAFSVSRAGEFKRAEELAEIILQKENNHVPTLSLLTSIYEKTGAIEKGWRIAETLLQQFPENPSINIIYGKYALRNKQQQLAIPSLLKAVKHRDIKTDDLLSLHMLLGKLYDSLAEYKAAFVHFQQANNLKYNDYNIQTYKNYISNTIDFFSKEKYKSLASSENDSSEIIFILGMPRSGTSLIEQIVSSHSSVHGGGELQHLVNVARLIDQPGGQYPQKLESLSNVDMEEYADNFLEVMRGLSSGKQKITDKLPHNFEYIGLIHKLLPNAKIINCLRNPLDTCLSCYFQHFGGHHPYAYNLSHLAQYYQQYSRLMDHWQNELEIPVLNVQYEKLVQNTQDEVQTLLGFLELEWEDSCLEFYKQKRAINTASYTQVKQKIYTGSLERWKNYESDIGELKNLLNKV